jgi:hypothetical protein
MHRRQATPFFETRRVASIATRDAIGSTPPRAAAVCRSDGTTSTRSRRGSEFEGDRPSFFYSKAVRIKSEIVPGGMRRAHMIPRLTQHAEARDVCVLRQRRRRITANELVQEGRRARPVALIPRVHRVGEQLVLIREVGGCGGEIVVSREVSGPRR